MLLHITTSSDIDMKELVREDHLVYSTNPTFCPEKSNIRSKIIRWIHQMAHRDHEEFEIHPPGEVGYGALNRQKINKIGGLIRF
jgi:hypothetical protein